jgi:hypothetical protein
MIYDDEVGTLTPGAQYVYESPDGGDTIYAREVGKTERKLVGMSVKKKTALAKMQEEQLWAKMCRAAETNDALQKAMEHCIVLYALGNEQ